MNSELLAKLSLITDEERKILNTNESIDQSIYMENAGNVINSKKLLGQGKLITIRPHTRFVHFPPHTHDYIELIYMCNGSTNHIINSQSVTLNKGELLFLSTDAVQEIEKAGENDVAVNFIIMPQFFDKVLALLGEEETPLKSFIINSISKKSNGEAYLHFKVADVLPIQNLHHCKRPAERTLMAESFCCTLSGKTVLQILPAGMGCSRWSKNPSYQQG